VEAALAPPQSTRGLEERRKLPQRGPGGARPLTNFLSFEASYRTPLPRYESTYWRYSRSGNKWQTLNNLQVALKHACVKRCKAKKYWGETILSSQYLEKYWGECPHCPYGVGAQQLPKISAHVLCPKRLDGARCHLVRR